MALPHHESSENWRHVVVTGGSGGIARALSFEFADAPWRLSAPGREVLDVREEPSVAQYFKSRPVELLVCSAGVIHDRSLAKLEASAWDDIFAVNFHGAAACARAALPRMVDAGTGHIVLISSRSAFHPPAGQAAYAAAKAALVGLSEALALRYGRNGIRVNVVVPGFLETPMTLGVTAARRAEILADHALGRFNTTQAVASFIRHLHEKMPHTSGQVFHLDSRAP